jgi:hypothetical protein
LLRRRLREFEARMLVQVRMLYVGRLQTAHGASLFHVGEELLPGESPLARWLSAVISAGN